MHTQHTSKDTWANRQVKEDGVWMHRGTFPSTSPKSPRRLSYCVSHCAYLTVSHTVSPGIEGAPAGEPILRMRGDGPQTLSVLGKRVFPTSGERPEPHRGTYPPLESSASPRAQLSPATLNAKPPFPHTWRASPSRVTHPRGATSCRNTAPCTMHHSQPTVCDSARESEPGGLTGGGKAPAFKPPRC